MVTKNINFKSFGFKNSNKKVSVNLKDLLRENEIINSLKSTIKILFKKYCIIQKYKQVLITGMGGSILPAHI